MHYAYRNEAQNPGVVRLPHSRLGDVYADRENPGQIAAARTMFLGDMARAMFRPNNRFYGNNNLRTTFSGKMGETRVRGDITERGGNSYTGGLKSKMRVVFIKDGSITGYVECGFDPYEPNPVFAYFQKVAWAVNQLGKLVSGRARTKKPAEYRPNANALPMMQGFGKPDSEVWNFLKALEAADRTDPVAVLDAIEQKIDQPSPQYRENGWPWTDKMVRKGRRKNFRGWNKRETNKALLRELHS